MSNEIHFERLSFEGKVANENREKFRIDSNENGKAHFWVYSLDGLTLSNKQTREVRDFLNKILGE